MIRNWLTSVQGIQSPFAVGLGEVVFRALIEPKHFQKRSRLTLRLCTLGDAWEVWVGLLRLTVIILVSLDKVRPSP